ncbi:U-box domain-containing protein 8-like [Panicum miliaceum]|uniref:U-box domain-containing protein 8-like n=1 Tax=Panicum miliaceum TaxID=4540 RepID=A0A3L6Q9U8_PANMI|nr:U-box domain-containing protein 8-like [Panicum miliaceum]
MGLTSLATVHINKCTIGAHPSVMSELVGLLRRGGPRERREAATALYEHCKLSENRRRAVREGAAPALADFTPRRLRPRRLGARPARQVPRGAHGAVQDSGHHVRVGPSGVAGSGNSRAIEQAALVLSWICSERKNGIGSDKARSFLAL